MAIRDVTPTRQPTHLAWNLHSFCLLQTLLFCCPVCLRLASFDLGDPPSILVSELLQS